MAKVTDIRNKRAEQRWDDEVFTKDQWLVEAANEYDNWLNAGQLQVAAAILRARRAGASWADVGRVLFVSRQEAWRRWKDFVEEVDEDPVLEDLLSKERDAR